MRSALKFDRAQNEIVSVVVVLHQSGFPQTMHGRFFDTRLYPVSAVATSVPFHGNVRRFFCFLFGIFSQDMNCVKVDMGSEDLRTRRGFAHMGVNDK